MAKIVNTKTNETVIEKSDYNAYGIVTDFCERENIGYHIFDCVSDIIKTMTGDAFTPFNTITEMISYIPAIVDCNEETNVLYLPDNSQFIVLGWDHEDNATIWTKVIQTINTDYIVLND